MTSGTKILLIIFLVGSTFLVCTLPFLPLPEEPIGFLVFLGRFHPLLLHFPIVLVLLTLTVEGLSIYQNRTQRKNSRFSKVSFLVGPLLIVSVISALVTAIGGYLLYRSGEYQGELVRQHLWGGVLLLLALNGATFLYSRPRFSQRIWHQWSYRILLLMAGSLIIITSHLGGTITHGQDFITEHMPNLKGTKPAPVEQKDPAELLIFQDLILPVIEDKCQSCHNQYKTKGGLTLLSYASIQKGGDSEKPLLVANVPSESELYHRITLPEDHDDKMPPMEKKPLNEDEIALINWWIKAGADIEMQLGAEPPDSISILMERFLPKLYQSERLKMRQENELEDLGKELANLGEEIGLVIELDPEYPGFFAISMQIPPANIDNQSISKLKPYASLFSKVSLAGADIDDDALFDIGRMLNLRDLYLPKTLIKGDGLIYLKDLTLLENLNLSNSLLSNQGILNLIHLPVIKTVYVWGAETDTLVLQTLRAHLPEVEILEEEGAYY